MEIQVKRHITKYLKKSILFTFLCIPIQQLHAEIVIPVFSGKWEFALDYKRIDNCSLARYQPEFNGNSASEVALNYLNQTMPQPRCTWTIKNINNDGGTAIPEDFPGTYIQWTTLADQLPYDTTATIDAVCLPAGTGEIGEAVLSDDVYPKYICPAGSRYGIDNVTGEIGCTTLPRLCEGDVVARSFNYPIMESFGHVGLTSPASGGTVNQVTQGDATLIDTVSFDQFKQKSAYWGDKYGVSSSPAFTSTEGDAIANEELQQKKTGKGQYYFLPRFIPIQSAQTQVYNQLTETWKVQDTHSYPEFRCDTFVDWVYSVGLKQQVIPFVQVGTQGEYKVYRYDIADLFKTPHGLYNALLNTRDNGSDLSSSPDSHPKE